MRRRPVCGSKKHSVNKSLIHDIAVSPDKKKKKKRKEKRKRKKEEEKNSRKKSFIVLRCFLKKIF